MRRRIVLPGLTSLLPAVVFLAAASSGGRQAPPETSPLSPAALAASPDGKLLYVACATAGRVAVFDASARKIARTFSLPGPPTGLALSPDGARLYVSVADPWGRIVGLETSTGTVCATWPAGHSATSPVLSPDGATLYVCNRFEDTVSALDTTSGRERYRAPVGREPIAADVTPDGKVLVVAHHLPPGPSDADEVGATVRLLEAATGKTAAEIPLPSGSTGVLGVKISPDGRHAAVTHLLARFHLPTTQLDRGWMNTNALTLIDVPSRNRINTVLLDNVDRGAANPWGVAWSPDGRILAVTHAGTHEVSLIDAAALLDKLARLPAAPAAATATYADAGASTAADVPNDLSFLVGVRRRLPCGGRGPRALTFAGGRLWTAHYFSDSLGVLDPAGREPAAAFPLGPAPAPSPVRRGEELFNDATICFQGWQSCASCHSFDGRLDGLNWDLLNDGIGNPKNTRSLLLSYQTPPAMSLGVRDTAETATRSGIRFILFSVRPEEEARALDEYLKSLRPIPSPHRPGGKPSEAARRGEKIFHDPAVGCAECHPPPLYTDLKPHDVGTKGRFDRDASAFDTPTLIELWRTAPYLHDGSVRTLRELFTTRNPEDRHGRTRNLRTEQIEDLVAFLLSL